MRQDNRVIADASGFFFPGARYLTLTEARIKDRNGKSAGNIDIVLVALDDNNEIVDFGAVEIQAVYISENVSKAFKEYMKNPATRSSMEWPARNYPNPDYLSSSRKRLAPQLIYKGGILHKWKKKLAVAVHKDFFAQLPHLSEVPAAEAEIAWMVYDLRFDPAVNRYLLERDTIKYTKFENALNEITTPPIGEVDDFLKYLKGRIDKGKTAGVPHPTRIPPEIEPLPEFIETESSGEGENEWE